jgi:HD-like signal output (HDOD) protein
MDTISPDKDASELAEQRFKMLEDIANELAGEVLFPTCFDIAFRIRQLLNDPDVSLDKLALVVSADPLISSKLLAMANSAAFSGKRSLRDVKGAIQRLGLKSVRTISLAIAMRQMLLLRGMADFAELAQRLWQHSTLAASASYVVARRMTRINPDEAYFAGMIHDIGAFYMLYRATQYPELLSRPESLKYLVVQWHESIGMSLMSALEVPLDIVEATRDHDNLRDAPALPKDLKDIVYIGNILAGSHFEWLYQDVDRATIERFALGQQYADLTDEIAEHAKSVAGVFS